jgi:hypothetical protein
VQLFGEVARRYADLAELTHTHTAFRTHIPNCIRAHQNSRLRVPISGVAFLGMLRPESWTGLAGGSPVPVGTGAPGSRPRFVVETRRAERGVESLFGGSKCAGRSVTRTLQPRQMYDGRAEPLMSRRRPCPANPGPGLVRRVFPGYGRRHVHTVWFGTGETRLPGLRRAKTKGISRW